MLGDKWKTSFVLLIMFFEPTTQQTHNYGTLHQDRLQNLGESPTVVLPGGCIEMCDDHGCLFFCPEPSKQIKRCVTRSTLNKKLCCTTDGPIAPSADTQQMLSMDPLDPETMAKYGGTPLNLAAQRNVARLQKAAEARLQLRKTLDNLKALREQRKIALANVKSKEKNPIPYKTKIMPSDLKDRKPSTSKIPSLDLTKIRRPLPIVNPSFNHNNNGGKISHYAIMDTTPDEMDEVRDVSSITAGGHIDETIPDENFNNALAHITEENSMLNQNTDLSLENSISNLTQESVPIVGLSNESHFDSGSETITNTLPPYSVDKQNGNVVSIEDYPPSKSHETQLINDGKPSFESFSAVPVPSSKDTEQTSYLTEQPSIEIKSYINEMADTINDGRVQNEKMTSLSSIHPSTKETEENSYMEEQPSINTGNLSSDTDVNYKPGNLDTPSKDLVESLVGMKGTPSVPEADFESKILKNEHIFQTFLTSSNEMGNSHSINVDADNNPLLAPERTSLLPVEGTSSSETNVSNEVSNLQSIPEHSIYHNSAKSAVEPNSSDSYLNEFVSRENITDLNNNYSGQENSFKAIEEEDVSEQPFFHSKPNLLNNVLNEAISPESTNSPVNEDISTFLSDVQKVGEHVKIYDQPDTNKLSDNENESVDTIHSTNIKDDEIKGSPFNSDANHALDDLITTYGDIVNREGYLSPQPLEASFGDSNIAEKHNLTGVSRETNNQVVLNRAEMMESGKPQEEAINIQPPKLLKTKNKIVCITDDKLDNNNNDLISDSVLNTQRVISKVITEQSEANNNGLRLPPGSLSSNEDDEQKSNPVIAYHYNSPRKMDLLPHSLTLEGKNIESNEMITLNEKSTNSPEEYGQIDQFPEKLLSRGDSERKNDKQSSDNKDIVSLPMYEFMPEGELSSERTETPNISILTNEKEMSNTDSYKSNDSWNTQKAINNENKSGSGDSLESNTNNPLDLINNSIALNLQNYNIEQRSAQAKDYFKMDENPAINSHFNSHNSQEKIIDEQNIPDYRPLIENDFIGDHLFHRDIEPTWYDNSGEGFKEHLKNNTFNDSKFVDLGDVNIGDVHYGPYVIHQPEIDYGKHVIKIKPDLLPTKNGTDIPINPENVDDSSRSDIRRSLNISELSENKINHLNFVKTDADGLTENSRESNASQEGEHFSESLKANKDFNNYGNSPESFGIAKSIDRRQYINSPIENDSHRLRTGEADLETPIESSTTVKYNVHQYDTSLFTVGELKEKQITKGSDGNESTNPFSKHESLTEAPEETSRVNNNSLMQILNSDVLQSRSSGFDEDHISDISLEEIEKLIKDGKMESLLDLYSTPSERQNQENVLHIQKSAYPTLNTSENSKNTQGASEPHAIADEENPVFEVDAPQIDSTNSSKQFINREREILIHEIKKFIEDPSISNVSRTPLFNDDVLIKPNLSGDLGKQMSYIGTEGPAIPDFSTEGTIPVDEDIPNRNGGPIQLPKSELVEHFTNSNYVTVNNTDNSQQDDVSDYNTEFIRQFGKTYEEQNANLNIYNSLNNTGKEKAIKSALHVLEDIKMKLSGNSTGKFKYGSEESVNEHLKLEKDGMDHDNSPIQQETSIPSKEPISTISHHHTVLLDNSNINNQMKSFNDDLNPLRNDEYPYDETNENSELDSVLGNDNTSGTEQYSIMGDILKVQSSRINSMSSNEVTHIKTSSLNGTTDFQKTVSSEVFHPTIDIKEENDNLSEVKPKRTVESEELILENDSHSYDQPLSQIHLYNETTEEPARVEKQLEISSKAQNGGSIEDLRTSHIDSNDYFGVKEDAFNNTFQSSSDMPTVTDINSHQPVSNTEIIEDSNSLENSMNGDNLSKNSSSNPVLKNILGNNLSSEPEYDEPSVEPILETSLAEDIIDKTLNNERKTRLTSSHIPHSENNKSAILDALGNISSEEKSLYVLDNSQNSNTENITNNKDILANIKKGKLNGIFDLYKLLDLNYSSHHQKQENEDDSGINLKSKTSGGPKKCSCNKEMETSSEIDSSREKRSKSSIYPPIYIFSGGNYVINVAGKSAISILPKADDNSGLSVTEQTTPFGIYKYIMGKNAQQLDSNEAEELIHETNIPFTGEDRVTKVKAKYADSEGHELKNENFSYTHNDDDSSDSINPNSNHNYHSSGSDLNPTPTPRTRDILEESFHSLKNGQNENFNYNLMHEENKTGEDQQKKDYDIELIMDKEEKPQFDSNNYGNNAQVWNNMHSENGPKIASNVFPNPYAEASYGRDSENSPVTEGPQISTNWSYPYDEGNLQYPASTYIYVRT